MRYEIEIACDNAAFEEDPGHEVRNILLGLEARISRNGLEDESPLFDTNGNRVGTARLEDR